MFKPILKIRYSTVYLLFLSTLMLIPRVLLASTDKDVMEEIFVTAQKREQDLQQIPIAISVLGDQQLKLQQIQTLGDLQDGNIPSLRIQPLGNTPSNLIISIRGNAPVDAGEVTREHSVAVYLDGVYLGRTHALGMDLVDLQRIEVLRGPQGTLFGRNAVGGAISLISKRPTGEWGMDQTLTTGRFNEFTNNTHINLPGYHDIKTKIDYVYTERDGYVDNTASDQSDYSAYQKEGIRLSADWALNNNFLLAFSYDKANVETAQHYTQLYIDNIGLIGAERKRQHKTRYPITSLKPTVSKQSGYNLTADWQVSDTMTIKSITAYRELDEDLHNNYGGVLYFNGISDISFLQQQQFSQEIQLIGATDTVEWVSGLFYFDEEADKTIVNEFSLDMFGLITGTPFTPITPPTTFDALGRNDYVPTRYIKAGAKSAAIYSQATWTPEQLNQLHLTLGVRYTRDKRSDTRIELIRQKSRQDQDHTDFSLAVNYAWTESLSSYGKWSTAYKAGGVNSRSEIFTPYQKEEAETIEIGLKSVFWNNRARLNAAIFSTEYKNMQIDFANATNVTLVETINADKPVTVEGLEVDLTVKPVSNLSVGISYAYLDDDMKYQQNPFVANTRKRFYTQQAPRHAGSVSLDYTFPAWRFGTLSAHIDVTSTDKYSYVSFGNQRYDAYTLANAKFTLSNIPIANNRSNINVSVWGKNIFDEDYIIYAFPAGDATVSQVFGAPQTIGVDLNVVF